MEAPGLMLAAKKYSVKDIIIDTCVCCLVRLKVAGKYIFVICYTFTPTVADSKHCMFDRMHPFEISNKLLIAETSYKPWNKLCCLQSRWPCF